MPTYEFKCHDCDYEFDLFMGMNDDRPTVCPHCDGDLRRVIGMPMIAPDIAPYESIVTGEQVSGRAAHRDHLDRHHLVEVGDQTSKRQRDYKETDFEQQVDWYRKKGINPPENLREQVDGKDG